jgi:dihydropteroate synthase
VAAARRLDTIAAGAQSDRMSVTESPDSPWVGGLQAEPGPLGRLLAENRPIVMGILNVTPDSFSDGGQFSDPHSAIQQAARMIEEGADIIDIGAESTRPYAGAKPVNLEEELARLQPVLPLVVKFGVPVSIDTMKAEIALWAVGHGVSFVNDVWGLQRDPAMARVVSDHGVAVIVMHNRYKADPTINILSDINAFFSHSIDIASRAGIASDAIVLDPGIGFGKTPEQSMQAVAQLDTFKRFGMPLMVGASRKRFIDTVSPSDPMERLGGSIAAHVMAYLNGAAIIRTHDVAETVQALRVAAAIRGSQ